MKVILLGPPGAGKGTQAARLAQRLGLAHLATGDLFRRAQGKGTRLGLLAKSYMEKGQLVPDDVTIAMVQERLREPDCKKGVIFDGFPRTLAQARALDEALARAGEKVDTVILVQVPEDELVRRLSGRWLCRTCQTPYHVVASPPKDQGRCDRCGGPLYQRVDDKEETVRQRLQVYTQQTAPLIEYFANQGKLLEIDGTKSIEAVADLLVDALSKTLPAKGKSTVLGQMSREL